MWELYTVQNHDREFYEEAFQWYSHVPGCLKALQELRGRYVDLEEFIESFNSGVVYRADVFSQPMALVFGEIHSDWTVEGHLICAPTASIDVCAALVTYAKVESLKTWDTVVCQVLKRHRSLVDIVERAGFLDSGMRAWQGVYRGNPQEVMYYVAENSHEKQVKKSNHKYVRVSVPTADSAGA